MPETNDACPIRFVSGRTPFRSSLPCIAVLVLSTGIRPICKSTPIVKIKVSAHSFIFYLPNFSGEMDDPDRRPDRRPALLPRRRVSCRTARPAPLAAGKRRLRCPEGGPAFRRRAHPVPRPACGASSRPSLPDSVLHESSRGPLHAAAGHDPHGASAMKPPSYASRVNSQAHQYSSGCASGGQATQRVLIRGSTADAKWLYSSTPVDLQG